MTREDMDSLPSALRPPADVEGPTHQVETGPCQEALFELGLPLALRDIEDLVAYVQRGEHLVQLRTSLAADAVGRLVMDWISVDEVNPDAP
jgi:hypothetical protein